MNLEKTKKLIEDGVRDRRFDSFALLVKKGSEKRILTAPGTDSDTYFDIASMGKVLVTATLILRAVGEGKLSLSDTLDKFFRVPDDRKNITVGQLLAHTSGIIRVNIPQWVADAGKDVIADFIIDNPLAYTPGTKYIYSCNAYILLGFIAEKVLGDTLDKLYEKYIKSPLGLTRSRFNIALDEPNAALSCKRRDVGFYRVDDENVYSMRGVAGNSAEFWTLSDVDRYLEAVEAKSDKLYAPYLYDLAEKNHTPGDNFAESRGLGWLYVDSKYHQTGRLFPEGSFGHCGHTGCSMFVSRAENLHVIILSNATRFLNMKNDFRGYNYGEIMKMREEFHNAIADDLGI